MLGMHFRNRTSFAKRAGLCEVFTDAVAEGIAKCLEQVDEQAQVISLPDLLIEADGLTLAGAHIVSQPLENGAVHVLLRFKLMLGGINRAFKEDIGFDDFVIDQNAHLSSKVLSDLALPLLNICAAAEAGLLEAAPPLQEFGAHMIEQAQEIYFQIELVKRFAHAAEQQIERPTEGLRRQGAFDAALRDIQARPHRRTLPQSGIRSERPKFH